MPLLPRPLLLPSARRGTALAAVVIASATLAGCTGSTSSSTGKQSKTLTGAAGQAQDVISDFSSRAGNTDAAGICREDLSTTAQDAYAKAAGSCIKGVAKAIATADSLVLDVTSVKVSSSGAAQLAVAQISTPDDIGTRSVVLGRPTSKDKWKIVSFDGSITKATSPAGSTPATSTTP